MNTTAAPVGGASKNGKPVRTTADTPHPDSTTKNSNPAAPVATTGGVIAAAPSVDREQRLKELEIVIENGVRGCIEMGRALREIRDSHLYKDVWVNFHTRRLQTFDEYCSKIWGFRKQHAHRLINGADLYEKMFPEGESHKGDKLPSGAVMLALMPLKDNPKAAVAALKRAKKKSPDGRPSGKAVTEEVNKELPPPSNGKGQPSNGKVNKAPKATAPSTGSPATNPVATVAPRAPGAQPLAPIEPVEEDLEDLDREIEDMFCGAADLSISIERLFPKTMQGPWVEQHLLAAYGFDRARVEAALDFFRFLLNIGDKLDWFPIVD